MNGVWLSATVSFVLGAHSAGAQDRTERASFVSDSVALVTATGTLRGTLLVPSGASHVPVVFMHPGSGPTDRDGNSALLPGKNNSLRLLAEGLAVRGIATLRVDKRGLGGSAPAMTAESDLTLESYVADAEAWLKQLRRDPRFDQVFALGHSEGALIMALAARKTGADGYISLAGPAHRASDLLRRQLRSKLTGRLAEENERILEALEHGERTDSVPAELQVLYRPSVQSYLISWFKYDPASVVHGLSIPVLIVQGMADLQVDTAEGSALHAVKPDATYLRVPAMNHVLKIVTGGLPQQRAAYVDSTLAVAPLLLDGMAAFVRVAGGNRPEGE